jgi:hypothetical protein
MPSKDIELDDFNPTFAELVRFAAEEIKAGEQTRINQAFLALFASLVAADGRSHEEVPGVEDTLGAFAPETRTV